MEGAKFCSSCGSPIISKKFCIQCGKEIPSEGKFCSFCGAPQENQSPKQTDSSLKDMVGKFPRKWFLNGKIPERLESYKPNEDGCEEYDEVTYDSYDNIVRGYWDGSSEWIHLLGCKNLDFAICELYIENDELLVNSHFDFCKCDNSNGWTYDSYNRIVDSEDDFDNERLSLFEYLGNFEDFTKVDGVYKIPYSDLDMAEFAKGNIVLTSAGKAKWTEIVKKDEAKSDYSCAESKENRTECRLKECCLVVDDNLKICEVALYADERGLYVKGSDIQTLKKMNREKGYIYSKSGIVKIFGDIDSSPVCWIDSAENGCDILAAAKREPCNLNLSVLDGLLK